MVSFEARASHPRCKRGAKAPTGKDPKVNRSTSISRAHRAAPRLALVLTFFLSTVAAAAPTPAESAQAKAHHEKGYRYYNLGDFDKAAEEYKEAYKLVPDPVILFNIGQAYRLGKNYERANFFYASYVRVVDAKQRPAAEARVKGLTAQMAAEETADKGREAKPEAPPPPPPAGAPKTGSERAAAIAAIIKGKRDVYRACFDKWSPAHPGVEGNFVLMLWLDPEGKLTDCSSAGLGLDAPEVETCLVEFARTQTWPPSGIGMKTRLAYPFNFKPR